MAEQNQNGSCCAASLLYDPAVSIWLFNYSNGCFPQLWKIIPRASVTGVSLSLVLKFPVSTERANCIVCPPASGGVAPVGSEHLLYPKDTTLSCPISLLRLVNLDESQDCDRGRESVPHRSCAAWAAWLAWANVYVIDYVWSIWLLGASDDFCNLSDARWPPGCCNLGG